MKNILSIISVFILCACCISVKASENNQKNVIYSVEDGTKLECTAKRIKGSIDCIKVSVLRRADGAIILGNRLV